MFSKRVGSEREQSGGGTVSVKRRIREAAKTYLHSKKRPGVRPLGISHSSPLAPYAYGAWATARVSRGEAAGPVHACRHLTKSVH